VWRLLSLCLAAFLVTTTAAAADPKEGAQTKTAERPSAGLFLGATRNGDPGNGGGGSGEIGLVFDTPITKRTRLRFDASRTSWDGKEDDGRGNIMPSDTITMTSMRVSVVSVRRHSPSYASYSGIGLGAYRYDFARTPVTHHWQGGVHFIFGLEFLRHGEHSAVNAEVRVHALGGPDVRPVTQAIVFKTDAVIGMKLRF